MLTTKGHTGKPQLHLFELQPWASRPTPGRICVEWRESADCAASYVLRAKTLDDAAAIVRRKGKAAYLGEFRCTLEDESTVWTTAGACRMWQPGSSSLPAVGQTVWQRELLKQQATARYACLIKQMVRRAECNHLVAHKAAREIIHKVREAFEGASLQ